MNRNERKEKAIKGLKCCMYKTCYDCPFKDEIACKLQLMTAALCVLEKNKIKEHEEAEDHD